MSEAKSLSDRELINRAKDNNTEAFHLLHDRYKKRIINYLYRYFGNYFQAEEVAQEAFIKVFKNLDKYKPTGTVRGWIYTIAANTAKNKLRQISKRQEVSLSTPLASDDESFTLEDTIQDKTPGSHKIAENKGFSKQIHRCIGQLSEKHKEVLILCGVQGLSYKEAAEILDISIKTVGVRLMRARQNLKKLLEESEEK